MTLIDGKALADKMAVELKAKVDDLKSAGVTPGLVVILVGENPASQVYVRNKERRATAAGFNSEVIRLSEDTTETALLELIAQLNQDNKWHGILVQLPLPAHISEEKILLAIDPDKDVDGFHPTNMGRLWSGNPVMIPSTPAGIMVMLETYGVEVAGKNALVIGRSNIVGKPMAQMLLDQHATVTIAHSRTQNLPELAKQADILVVAIGRGNFVTAEFVKPGAVVIDVGMNRDDNGKLIGDVKFDEVEPIASLMTPVPGGVGPMTITMLMEQTYEAAKRTLSK
ncbi:bifunctional methylenetetrahydrofolate dehydrogenase/methenyltetrahydrofolate cyclohydrolase [Pseudolactococcus raffinolactis]|jgi:methylenetetrahydrofolate dehydrogenase (NADP+) / methenyltetrahydrofolate cyclohydrolase|uniref:Bifunctional protein FolD n=1 Tax=Pseudolactococcus raffinolactis TaxID=1366 RepID=A0A290PWH1_9LACT|nr:bifunctional methylenetetrahydrofolate dehydrogenase/methenyltetrahydrofolate cyclohydrolase [Lactococcus raffinolactis]MBR2542796.1 bifunctional methylenetetrahydrofolate dehydrogenase/methenyltetrahydrofolate cyclohydrolase [Lactococcus sp.]ATC60594.1 bifunctional methylenetetrahydrofolate dehydrogenase/methenyltetrahydrofolate cyclohydrolase [Lactococcus raffinolactis]MBW9297678.1 bifunctional methylenetetrahydrofolate dehydrogenase/methenyltetrahydrofolate cyclohydrolase [Lactococcus raff